MSTVSSFLFTAGCVLGAVRELTRYTLRPIGALLLPKAQLAARVLAADSQLAVALNRSGGGRRRRQLCLSAACGTGMNRFRACVVSSAPLLSEVRVLRLWAPLSRGGVEPRWSSSLPRWVHRPRHGSPEPVAGGPLGVL